MEERIYNPKFYPDKEIKGKIGIYQIRNLVNNKIYVGSATDFCERKSQHFSLLKRKKHNKKLQNSYNKHGKENFVFEIIEFVENKDKLLEREQYWIDKLNAVEEGYNIQPIAGKPPSNKGMKFSQKHRDNLSKNSGNKISVICLETKQIFSSANKAGKYLNKDSSHITGCCKNKYNTAYNLHWMYYNEYLKASKAYIDFKLSLENKKRIKVICLDTGEIFNSVTEAGNIKNICSNSITQCCKGIYKTAGKLRWSYVDKNNNM